MPDINDVRYDPALLPEARRQANAVRGDLVRRIETGSQTAWGAVTEAAVSEDPALLRLRLSRLVGSQGPSGSAALGRRVCQQVLNICEPVSSGLSDRDVTLSYVLDARAGGKRVLATLDALIAYDLIGDPDDVDLWEGFPFSPTPVLTSDPRKDHR